MVNGRCSGDMLCEGKSLLEGWNVGLEGDDRKKETQRS